MGAEVATGDKITFREAPLNWLKLGFISFGGPTGKIATPRTSEGRIP
jgi:chromate transport protein ChrA